MELAESWRAAVTKDGKEWGDRERIKRIEGGNREE